MASTLHNARSSGSANTRTDRHSRQDFRRQPRPQITRRRRGVQLGERRRCRLHWHQASQTRSAARPEDGGDHVCAGGSKGVGCFCNSGVWRRLGISDVEKTFCFAVLESRKRGGGYRRSAGEDWGFQDHVHGCPRGFSVSSIWGDFTCLVWCLRCYLWCSCFFTTSVFWLTEDSLGFGFWTRWDHWALPLGSLGSLVLFGWCLSAWLESRIIGIIFT